MSMCKASSSSALNYYDGAVPGLGKIFALAYQVQANLKRRPLHMLSRIGSAVG
jgi:hypothetical protein